MTRAVAVDEEARGVVYKRAQQLSLTTSLRKPGGTRRMSPCSSPTSPASASHPSPTSRSSRIFRGLGRAWRVAALARRRREDDDGATRAVVCAGPDCSARLPDAILATASGRYDPRLRFRTISTPRFDIHFHQGEEAQARRLAALAEAVAAALDKTLGPASGRVQVILVDQSDLLERMGDASPLQHY